MNAPVIEYVWEAGADQSIPLPRYETPQAAGADIRANFPNRGSATLTAGERMLIPTGLRFAIPQGFELQIRPRSGLALKHGISIPNAPGTIDSDYRGPIGVLLINLSPHDFIIHHGDRIAQIVIAPVVQTRFKQSQVLNETTRGEGGFGSTGVRG